MLLVGEGGGFDITIPLGLNFSRLGEGLGEMRMFGVE